MTAERPRKRCCAWEPVRFDARASPDDPSAEPAADRPLPAHHAPGVSRAGDGRDGGLRVLRAQVAAHTRVSHGGRPGATAGLPGTPARLGKRTGMVDRE